MLLNKEIITWNLEFGQPLLINIEGEKSISISGEPPKIVLLKFNLE